MTARTTWQAIVSAMGITALILVVITYPAYLAVFHSMWRPSAEGSFAGYVEYMMTLFVTPITLFAVCILTGSTLIVRRRISDVFLLFLIISAVGFVGSTAGLFVNELGQDLLAYTPKMAKMASSAISAAISGGLLLGILMGAKANRSGATHSNV